MSGCLYRSGNNKDNPQEIFVAGRLRETLATTPVVPKMPLAKPEPLLSSQVCFSKKIAADYFIIAPLFFQPQDVQDLPGSPQTLLDIGRIHTTSLGAPTALNPSPSTNYSSDDQM